MLNQVCRLQKKFVLQKYQMFAEFVLIYSMLLPWQKNETIAQMKNLDSFKSCNKLLVWWIIVIF